jgi:hypothetical protein
MNLKGFLLLTAYFKTLAHCDFPNRQGLYTHVGGAQKVGLLAKTLTFPRLSNENWVH